MDLPGDRKGPPKAYVRERFWGSLRKYVIFMATDLGQVLGSSGDQGGLLRGLLWRGVLGAIGPFCPLCAWPDV